MSSLVLVCLAAIVAIPQQKTIAKGELVTATATIQSIDVPNRTVTVRNENGTDESIYVPPSVTRFNEFKVGDKVTARYYESVVLQLRKPGEASQKAETITNLSRGAGAAPAAALAKQVTMTVEVMSMDPAAPSITIKTQDGQTITRKIADAKNLEGVSVGDRIDITITQAAMVNLTPATPK